MLSFWWWFVIANLEGQLRVCALPSCGLDISHKRSDAKYCCRGHKNSHRGGAPECSVEGCDRRSRGRGLCGKHYQRLRKHGSATPEGVQERDHYQGACVVEGCQYAACKRRMCSAHYQRLMKYGDVSRTQHRDVTAVKERRCRTCGTDITHMRSNATSCSKYCKYLALDRIRAERVKGNPGSLSVSDETRQRILRRANGCAYCGARSPLEIDHVIPLSLGGRHAEGNLVAACRTCNSDKSNLLLVEWKRQTNKRG